MQDKYINLIEQTFEFPTEEFFVEDGFLHFHGLKVMDLVEKYGSPLKFTYLPKISENIQKSKQFFADAMKEHNFKAKYYYCYCTKSNHFSYVMDEVLKNDVELETSSTFDIDIVEKLYNAGKIDKTKHVHCNGYKDKAYLDKIAKLINGGFKNTIPILDNQSELKKLTEVVQGKLKFGIRMASEEEPKFEFYTSRLGIGYKDIIKFYNNFIKDNPDLELSMLHFFVNTGIRDNAYYWNELQKALKIYAELRKICPTLKALNIGGGFPIKNSLGFAYDYQYMATEIIGQIKSVCDEHNIPHPDIYTEFGSFTVGESAGAIYSIVDQKQQNDMEKWNMIDSSFITTLPDTWAINKRFILLPINRWEDKYERVFLGGMTCDSDDYYNSEQHVNAIFLPNFNKQNKLYIGFFNTGAYQETIGGYGGLHHCLIPQPKHIVVGRDAHGNLYDYEFSKEQTADSMLNLLGY